MPDLLIANLNLLKQSIICLLIILSQTSCVTPRRSQKIIIASTGKISSLDPAQASTFHALQLISALGDTLYVLDENGILQPKLAEGKPKVSDNGLSILIPLKKNILFHDGTRFNSKAMAFSLRRFIRIGTLNYLLSDRIKSIETPEEFILKINLTKRVGSLNGILTSVNLTPVSPKSYINHQDKFLNKNFIGTGPYKLESFDIEQQNLTPFKSYWGKQVSNKGISFITLSNSTSLFSAFNSGSIDVLLSNSMDEDQHYHLHKLAKKKKLREGEGRAMEIGYITLRSNKYPLKNTVLRKAVSYTLNRKLISQRVSYGLREPLLSIVPSQLNYKDKTIWPKYNPELARKLMKSAGYCSNRNLVLTFTYRSNVPADKLLALTWQEQINRDLSDCMKLKINGVESTTVYRQLSKGSFEAVMLDWRGAFPDPEAYLRPLISCTEINGSICKAGEAAASGSFWSSESIQKKLAASDYLTGTERLKKLNEVEHLAKEGAAYLPVWLVKPRAWAQKNISTPEFNSTGQLIINRLNRFN